MAAADHGDAQGNGFVVGHRSRKLAFKMVHISIASHAMLINSRGSRSKMAFVVRAISGKLGDGTFIVDKATRKDAFETAAGLLGQGMSGVTIMSDDGRVYTTARICGNLRRGFLMPRGEAGIALLLGWLRVEAPITSAGLSRL
jgi:hypothetical protein